MDVKLKVLAGAKVGTEIPLKKDKFIIGRSRDCSLRAGSDAISRRHCVLRLKSGVVSIRDLGSRNGTYLNDERIDSETPLKAGDELRIGPLRFEVLVGQGINRTKRPKVKDVADAASRTASGGSDVIEDDISRWLVDGVTSASDGKETQTISAEETGSVVLSSGDAAAPANGSAPESDTVDDKAAEDRTGKKSVGKLPNIPKKTAKDSREAAAEVLRALSRRR